MTTDNNHPITPPFELLQQWRTEYWSNPSGYAGTSTRYLADKSAQWGADKELEACCEVLARELICDGKNVATDLRAARRPKPPSLKEQALDLIDRAEWNSMVENLGNEKMFGLDEIEIIRRALEALDD